MKQYRFNHICNSTASIIYETGSILGTKDLKKVFLYLGKGFIENGNSRLQKSFQKNILILLVKLQTLCYTHN